MTAPGISRPPAPSRPLARRLPDPDDEPFLEAAIAGAADCLVTGNVTHFSPEARAGARVVTPADFIELYRARLAEFSSEELRP